ncbi:MAG: ricin-type beta-trefoil lectin domain protein [Candidatus Saccharimonadales bacterium]
MIRLFPHALDQKGIAHRFMPVGIGLVLIFSVFMTLRSVSSHADNVDQTVRSGMKGYCLDVHNNSTDPNTVVDSWSCNGSDAQKWNVLATSVEHGKNLCLSVYKNATFRGTSIVLNPCNKLPGQVWLEDNKGLYNPNSGLCLSMPPEATEHPLILDSCNNITQPFKIWQSATLNSCQNESEQESVACNAVKQWTLWQSPSVTHLSLLNSYTSGATYEEWCADFVSYVYKEAGHPFKNGETNGWDENIASNIQYQGFTLHQAGQYIPKTGDVAYFNYEGGHVEIVVSGGSKPTFVYGNSATVDPSTGNGQMKANTITEDGGEGSVQYYLTPRS